MQNNSRAGSLAFKNNEPYNAFRSVETDCAHSTNPSQGGITRRHVWLASLTTLAVTYISYDSFILRNVIAIQIASLALGQAKADDCIGRIWDVSLTLKICHRSPAKCYLYVT